MPSSAPTSPSLPIFGGCTASCADAINFELMSQNLSCGLAQKFYVELQVLSLLRKLEIFRFGW
jgi:hypothetical protein